MTVTVRQLAEWVRGEVLGDGELPIANARTLPRPSPATSRSSNTTSTSRRGTQARRRPPSCPRRIPVNGRPMIRVADPLMAFVESSSTSAADRPKSGSGISPTAHDPSERQARDGVTVGRSRWSGKGPDRGRMYAPRGRRRRPVLQARPRRDVPPARGAVRRLRPRRPRDHPRERGHRGRRVRLPHPGRPARQGAATRLGRDRGRRRRSARAPRSTAARSARRASGPARRSTTW